MKKRFYLGTGIFVVISLFLGTLSFAQPVKKIKIGFDGDIDGGKLPRLIAFEQAGKYGVEVTPVFFPNADTSAKAVISGNVQMGTVGSNILLNAIAAGQPLKVVAETTKSDFILATPVSIKTIKDLEGKRVAIHGPRSQTEALMKWVENRYKMKFQYITVPGSEVRVETLSKGQIDASPVQMLEFINLDNREPGRFHILLSFSEASDTISQCLFARTDWIAQNGDIIEGVLRSLLEIYRRVNADPPFLKERAPKYLPGMDAKVLNRAADEYIKHKIWDVNLGVSEAGANGTVKFYMDAGILKQDVPADKWTDTRFLDKVLNEAGRK